MGEVTLHSQIWQLAGTEVEATRLETTLISFFCSRTRPEVNELMVKNEPSASMIMGMQVSLVVKTPVRSKPRTLAARLPPRNASSKSRSMCTCTFVSVRVAPRLEAGVRVVWQLEQLTTMMFLTTPVLQG